MGNDRLRRSAAACFLIAAAFLAAPVRAADSTLVEPGWMSDPGTGKVHYVRGSWNFAIYRIPELARDLNAVAVGHAMAYEDLVRGRAATLESETFHRIDHVLHHQPGFMPDEGSISPFFGRRYGSLEQLFEWAHLFHAETIDVLAGTEQTDAEKDATIERLWDDYRTRAPFVVTGLPMNMEVLDSRPWSRTFRRGFPKVNGLFWGYHWLQTSMYDLLWHVPPDFQKRSYDVIDEQYHRVELYRTDRGFMPMMAENSPRFSARFPAIANMFDNLHMLHDMVNDILSTDTLSESEREAAVRRAMVMVLDTTHAGELAGGGAAGTLHDHRFADGMPGMGMMPKGTPELMYMPDMGWMNMRECQHCSVRLPDGENRWMRASVSAAGWTMEVRCPLCARDMASQTPGRAIIHTFTEDSTRVLVLLSDASGRWTANIPDAVFLEIEADHPECNSWSRAFTSREAFDRYVAENPRYAKAVPLSLEEWSLRSGKEPETYEAHEGPVENPYEDSGGPGAPALNRSPPPAPERKGP